MSLLVFFNAAAHAQRHDDQCDEHTGNLPRGVPCGRGVKPGGERPHVGQPVQSAGERSSQIVEDPPHNHRVTDGHGQRAKHRDEAQSTARTFASAAAFCGLPKGVDGAAAGGTAEGHFTDYAGRADERHKNQIGNQKGCTAVGGDPDGKSQMLPIPTAEPMQARSRPGLQESRLPGPGLPPGGRTSRFCRFGSCHSPCRQEGGKRRTGQKQST